MTRRILSLWFPRLAAERALRLRRDALDQPFAVVEDRARALVLSSLSPAAEAAGLTRGQALRDATAMCPGLVTHHADPQGEAAFLTHLRRWAGKFSPWVAEEAPEGLIIDLTGCSHLFGGEEALLAQVEGDCAALGLSVRAGVGDTPGAAWALARFAGQARLADAGGGRSGDDIAQEARATRSRAVKRRSWERGGALQVRGRTDPGPPQGTIAPPGQMRQALAPLPLAALRLPPAIIESLTRLGLRRIDDILGLPRASVARRFGAETVKRLDQAMGIEPEPVSPAAAPLHFAARLTFPDPIGTLEDIAAGVERLLPPLCTRLLARGHGARRLRLQAFRVDGQTEIIEVTLARPATQAERMRPLLALKYDQIDPGFGIDCLRLEAVLTETLSAVQHRGPVETRFAAPSLAPAPGDEALSDLIGKLGARLGSEAVTRSHPTESYLPEKAAMPLAAAWADPWPERWPAPAGPRPLVLFAPERIGAPEDPMPPGLFRWRRRPLTTRIAMGPERIMPEWWFDLPDWRCGPRDYWRIEAETGERLWMYFAHGGDVTGGWFCHGQF
jgi:protein ImuB